MGEPWEVDYDLGDSRGGGICYKVEGTAYIAYPAPFRITSIAPLVSLPSFNISEPPPNLPGLRSDQRIILRSLVQTHIISAMKSKLSILDSVSEGFNSDGIGETYAKKPSHSPRSTSDLIRASNPSANWFAFSTIIS